MDTINGMREDAASQVWDICVGNTTPEEFVAGYDNVEDAIADYENQYPAMFGVPAPVFFWEEMNSEYTMAEMLTRYLEANLVFYRVDYQTGAGNFVSAKGNLDDVKDDADEGARYTQQSIVIYNDADGEEITRRPWSSVLDGWEDCDNPIRYGEFGYYGDWT